MALVRKPTPPRDPDEGEGFSSDQFVRPAKAVAPVRNDELAPTKPADYAAAATAPPPAKPEPVAEPAPAPAADDAEREAISEEVAKAFRPPAPKFVGRTTAFEDLELHPDVARDPDARRYFNYMRLFSSDHVPGGLNGLPYERVRQSLSAGRWGKRFTYHVEGLIAEGLVGSRTMIASRFNGMLPVYKAWASMFRTDKELKMAVLEDIQVFVKSMKESGRFPPFAYRVIQ
jgi:hypothetical protein